MHDDDLFTWRFLLGGFGKDTPAAAELIGVSFDIRAIRDTSFATKNLKG
jgi:hypothetical protein